MDKSHGVLLDLLGMVDTDDFPFTLVSRSYSFDDFFRSTQFDMKLKGIERYPT